MENQQDIQRSFIDSNDIESRLIILKRRAAEADFLREERDLLISRLKLYNPDYIWPDTGVNKCLSLPIDKEFEEVKKRNDQLISENGELMELKKQLISENDDLKANLHFLEKELEDQKKNCSDLEDISKENEELKTALQEMNMLKEEKAKLLIEKEQLKEDLNKLLDINTNEQNKTSKILINQLYFRINNISEQCNNLQKMLFSKEIQIDVLTGKITQLNAKLHEPYIAAKIKLSMGQNLSDEEAYMWAVYNLEMTNKKMNCELQKVTDQLNLVTEKYLKMKDELKPKDRVVSPEAIQRALHRLKEEQEDDWELNRSFSISNIYDISEKGSTAPVTRDASEESMFHPLGLASSLNRLEILRENTRYMDELYHKIKGIKYQMKEGQKPKHRVSRIQDVNIRKSVNIM